ncbi:hypothetical protein EI94DRAFT_137841 [Lactarius quietus]|nr:hypothetical protein EI94DRAFT_137841 [Lactarius quietus]
MAILLDQVPSSSPIVAPLAFRTSLLLQLPIELLDLIASFVATHRDLVSLALSCHVLAHIVLPAHAAYRTIRIHGQRGPTPWVTIASRPNCAAGVRCLVLFDQSEEDRFLPERAPSTALISATSAVKLKRAGVGGTCKPRGNGWNTETLEVVASAVRAMPNLHTLVFSGSLWRGRAPECRAAEMKFWAAVVAGACGSLRRLEYSQPPRDVPVSPPRSTAEVQMNSLWSISNLTSLSVKHAAFLRHPSSVVQFSRVLRNSPSLEVLFASHLFSSYLIHFHARASRLQCTTHLSTCTISCTTCASHTYKLSHSTFSRLKHCPMPARSPCCSSAHRRFSTSHGGT